MADCSLRCCKSQRLVREAPHFSGCPELRKTVRAVGGNHEAANHLWELHNGGWVAPNIYYLGAAGVVNFAGIRIGGLSGIFNGRHYRQACDENSIMANACLG